MKRLIILFATLACALGARAQHDHDHETGDHSNETVGALFEQMSEAVAAQPGERRLYSFTGVAPRFGLATQKGIFAEAGVSLDFYKLGYTGASEYLSFGYSNLRPYLSGEIMSGRRPVGGKHALAGGKAGVEYIRSTPILGMAFGGDVSYYTDGTREAMTLTPRLMLSLVKVELFYGYNFFLRNELTRHIGHHRFGVSMTLNGRFWKRKRTIREEYYNTYVEE